MQSQLFSGSRQIAYLYLLPPVRIGDLKKLLSLTPPIILIRLLKDLSDHNRILGVKANRQQTPKLVLN